MDREEHKELMMRRIEISGEIAGLYKELNEIGRYLMTLGSGLQSKPELMAFINAPSPFGVETSGAVSQEFDYEAYPRIDVVADKIQRLRRKQTELQVIQSKLSKA